MRLVGSGIRTRERLDRSRSIGFMYLKRRNSSRPLGWERFERKRKKEFMLRKKKKQMQSREEREKAIFEASLWGVKVQARASRVQSSSTLYVAECKRRLRFYTTTIYNTPGLKFHVSVF